VYYLHGRGDDEHYQLRDGQFCQRLQCAMAAGKVAH
jgi:hypothetical protein